MIKNIAISGPIGSGTTTLGRGLAKVLGWRFIEGGEIFTSIHNELKLKEEQVDKRPDEIDVAFDMKIKKLLQGGKHQVIESHLAGLNAKGLDGVFKIRLVCEENGEDKKEIRIDRVAHRDGLPMEEAKQQVLQRERGNVEKYERVYGVNPYTDDSLYDITINTFETNEEETLKRALEALGK